MSNDLVKRLRDFEQWMRDPDSQKFTLSSDLFAQAADHIEELNRAFEAYATETMERIDELEAALRRLVSWGAACPTEREERLSHAAEGAKAFHAARAALGEDVHD